ncbi:MAG: RidA family protein [Bacteroidota bacterium]
MKVKELYSERGPEPVGLYPSAKQAGDFLFISGVGPRKLGQKSIPGVKLNEEGEVESYDIEIQTRSVLDNVKLILEDCGSSWENLLDITVFLTDMKSDFSTFNKLYAEYFKGTRLPARTTIEVNKLPTPIAIELKCTALIKK